MLWQQEALRQRRWDDYCAGRPICGGCGRPILEDRALVMDEEMICDRCVEQRKVWIEM